MPSYKKRKESDVFKPLIDESILQIAQAVKNPHLEELRKNIQQQMVPATFGPYGYTTELLENNKHLFWNKNLQKVAKKHLDGTEFNLLSCNMGEYLETIGYVYSYADKKVKFSEKEFVRADFDKYRNQYQSQNNHNETLDESGEYDYLHEDEDYDDEDGDEFLGEALPLIYYPKEAHPCLIQNNYIDGSDADIIAIWKRKDRNSICHAHMEGFWILAEDMVDWIEQIADKIKKAVL